jgi:hypothetical protein
MEDRILRERLANLESYDDRTSNASSNDCDVSVLAQTAVKKTYPVIANAVYFLQTGALDSKPTEGSAATITLDGGSLFAVGIGSAVPPVGTNVIVSSVAGRWVFRFDSSSTTS